MRHAHALITDALTLHHTIFSSLHTHVIFFPHLPRFSLITIGSTLIFRYAMGAVERCPPELWTAIFKLTCIDGGITGCFLSLVSKRFNDISAPVRYQSVAVHGGKPLYALLEVFQRQAPIDRHVRHLLVTKRPPRADWMHGMSAAQDAFEDLLN